ncbi:hypothetical protein FACUT_7708 [Fusarium acutatum]|uniref:Uncharacterized protein n=1 Tax=Fusarium acutatum TaxID=78861 RepID=A0A8H4JPE4_9HYPO|nr:hypothetical protein FACUT_7708 [Fusarium acutatum]
MRLTGTLAASKRNFTILANGGSKLVWKAYAIALQAHMTTRDDLDNSTKAIFVASPGLFDIPAGEFAPQQITNDHIFRRTDSVHDDAMSSSDVGGSISKLRSEVEQAQDRSAQAYLRDLDLYQKFAAVAGSQLINFEAWGEKFDIYYAWAKSEQKRLESDYTLAAIKTSSSVGLVLAAFDLARDTSTLSIGSNMPCSNMDIPSSIRRAQTPLVVPADQIYYPPLYSINGIDRKVDSWVGAQDGSREEIELDLDLVNAKSASWESLGFPDLDHDPLYDTKVVDTTSPDVILSLKAGGMQPFDVDRGLYRDISTAARSQLGSAVGNEGPSGKLMKITGILLGYKVEIRMTCADGKKSQLSEALAGSSGEKILGMTTDRCTVHNDDGQVVVASAPSGFLTVLAVLGREI